MLLKENINELEYTSTYESYNKKLFSRSTTADTTVIVTSVFTTPNQDISTDLTLGFWVNNLNYINFSFL